MGETKLNLLILYADMKTKNHTETFDLRHQPDHKTLKKINYFKNTALIPTMLDCLYY